MLSKLKKHTQLSILNNILDTMRVLESEEACGISHLKVTYDQLCNGLPDLGDPEVADLTLHIAFTYYSTLYRDLISKETTLSEWQTLQSSIMEDVVIQNGNPVYQTISSERALEEQMNDPSTPLKERVSALFAVVNTTVQREQQLEESNLKLAALSSDPSIDNHSLQLAILEIAATHGLKLNESSFSIPNEFKNQAVFVKKLLIAYLSTLIRDGELAEDSNLKIKYVTQSFYLMDLGLALYPDLSDSLKDILTHAVHNFLTVYKEKWSDKDIQTVSNFNNYVTELKSFLGGFFLINERRIVSSDQTLELGDSLLKLLSDIFDYYSQNKEQMASFSDRKLLPTVFEELQNILHLLNFITEGHFPGKFKSQIELFKVKLRFETFRLPLLLEGGGISDNEIMKERNQLKQDLQRLDLEKTPLMASLLTYQISTYYQDSLWNYPKKSDRDLLLVRAIERLESVLTLRSQYATDINGSLITPWIEDSENQLQFLKKMQTSSPVKVMTEQQIEHALKLSEQGLHLEAAAAYKAIWIELRRHPEEALYLKEMGITEVLLNAARSFFHGKAYQQAYECYNELLGNSSVPIMLEVKDFLKEYLLILQAKKDINFFALSNVYDQLSASIQGNFEALKRIVFFGPSEFQSRAYDELLNLFRQGKHPYNYQQFVLDLYKSEELSETYFTKALYDVVLNFRKNIKMFPQYGMDQYLSRQNQTPTEALSALTNKYVKILVKHGYAPACFDEGMRLYKLKDYAKAARYLQLALSDAAWDVGGEKRNLANQSVEISREMVQKNSYDSNLKMWVAEGFLGKDLAVCLPTPKATAQSGEEPPSPVPKPSRIRLSIVVEETPSEVAMEEGEITPDEASSTTLASASFFASQMPPAGSLRSCLRKRRHSDEEKKEESHVKWAKTNNPGS